MFDLTGMKALVTGASGGIGSPIAAALGQQGADVALSGTNMQRLEASRARMNEGKHCLIAADLNDSQAVDGLVPAVIDRLGGLDILINNAGVTHDSLAMRMKDEEWASVIRINLEAAFRLCRAAIKPMIRARFGRIITISSIVGATGNPGQSNYAAAKAGLIGMTKALAQELAARPITANCIAPGFIDSPMTDALSEPQKQALNERIPM